MAFRRRDDQQNGRSFLGQLLSGVAMMGTQLIEADKAKKTELGNTAITSAKDELTSLRTALSDPDTKLKPEVRQTYEARVAQLNNVANTDPLSAGALYGRINENLPGGMTDPAVALTKLMAKNAAGDRAQEQQVNRADRNYQLGRDQAGYAAQASEGALNRGAQATEGELNRGNATENALLGVSLDQYRALTSVVNDRASSLQEKNQAKASLKQMEAENPELAKLNFSAQEGVTSQAAVAGQAAQDAMPTVLLEGAQRDNRLKELAENGEVFQQQVAGYDFSQRKLTDSQDLAMSIDKAAQSGDVATLAQQSVYLANPEAYPEEVARLQQAGIDGKIIRTATIAANRVRNGGENLLKIQQQTAKQTLTNLQTENQMNDLNILGNYADTFDTTAELENFVKKSPKLAKQFGEEGLSTLRAKVKLRENLYRQNADAASMETMLTSGRPNPNNYEGWKASFVETGTRAGVSPKAAAQIADQTIAGWERDGAEYDTGLATTQLENSLLEAQVENAEFQNSVAPQQVALDIETTRANLSLVRSNQAYTQAQAALTAAEAADYPNEAARKAALDAAQLRVRETQATANQALATQRNAQAKKTGEAAPSDNIDTFNAARQNISEQIAAAVTTAPPGCFMAPAGSAAEMFSYGVQAGPEGGNPVCTPVKEKITALQGELSRNNETMMRATLTQTPVTLGGQQVRLNQQAFESGSRISELDFEIAKLESQAGQVQNCCNRLTRGELHRRGSGSEVGKDSRADDAEVSGDAAI